MPARDYYHQVVRTALQKDGWTITHDPYRLKLARKKNLYTHILHQYKNISTKRRSRVPIKGTPTQLTCRGALYGYPQIYAFTSPSVLVQDVSI